MKKTSQKYGIRSLSREFPNEAACLRFIFDTLHTRSCSCGGTYSPLFHTDPSGDLTGRRQFQCGKCRFQIAPTAGTIFHKSVTPLMLWFHAILVFSNAKSGISAKELQRELEVTYKCAYRILTQIKKSLIQDTSKLTGKVEVDTGLFGGVGKSGKGHKRHSEVIQRKPIVAVAVERGGRMRAEVIENHGGVAIRNFVRKNVDESALLITDSAMSYESLPHRKRKVNHSKGFVRGKTHINTVETFFAHLKRSIRGTFKTVSKQKLQSYLDAFVFHYNTRHSDKHRFEALLGGVLHA